MGTTMTGIVECWYDKTQYYQGHWDNVAEIEFNKWYELHATVYRFPDHVPSDASHAAKQVVEDDISHGFRAIPFADLEKLWEGFDSTTMATVEFMRVMEACGYHTRLVVYFT